MPQACGCQRKSETCRRLSSQVRGEGGRVGEKRMNGAVRVRRRSRISRGTGRSYNK